MLGIQEPIEEINIKFLKHGAFVTINGKTMTNELNRVCKLTLVIEKDKAMEPLKVTYSIDGSAKVGASNLPQEPISKDME